MRYDTPVYFVYEGTKTYNQRTGNYDSVPEVQRLYRSNVIETSVELQRLLYGQLKQGCITVYVRGTVEGEPDYIDIEGTRYRIDKIRKRKTRSSYVALEVQ